MTTDKARKQAIRARMAATGEPYSVAARALAAELARRTATATATYLPEQGWRLAVDDSNYPDGRRSISWPLGLPHNDRATVLRQLGGELSAYGWDIATPPAADPVPDTLSLPLVRNDHGVRLDEVDAIHDAAGVDYHTAHHAYIETVFDAVASTGLAVCQLDADTDEPRGGGFWLSDEGEDFFDNDGPATCIAWRENRGWYEIGYSDRTTALGNYAQDLPGHLGVCALPQHVAAAVLDVAKPNRPITTPQPWTPPAGYEEDPELPEDHGGWGVSPALERSLVAYVRPRDEGAADQADEDPDEDFSHLNRLVLAESEEEQAGRLDALDRAARLEFALADEEKRPEPEEPRPATDPEDGRLIYPVNALEDWPDDGDEASTR